MTTSMPPASRYLRRGDMSTFPTSPAFQLKSGETMTMSKPSPPSAAKNSARDSGVSL